MGSETWSERYKAVEPKLEEKRFNLSKEPFAKERLQFLKKQCKSFMERHSEALGFAIFGSMSKGSVSLESDIDLLVFYDDEKFTKDFDANYYDLENFKNEIEKTLGTYVDSIRVFTGEKIISETLQSIREAIANQDHRWLRQQREFVGFHSPVVGLFMGIQVGGNAILKYRKFVLDQLKSMGEEGERIWKFIILTIVVLEHPRRKMVLEKDELAVEKFTHLYPQTIDDAMKYFVEKKPFRK